MCSRTPGALYFPGARELVHPGVKPRSVHIWRTFRHLSNDGTYICRQASSLSTLPPACQVCVVMTRHLVAVITAFAPTSRYQHRALQQAITCFGEQ